MLMTQFSFQNQLMNGLVLIFQKKCRKSTLSKYYFNLNNSSIEIVNNHTYLGVTFSSSGSFKDCKSNLKDKARRSIFATRRYLSFSRLPLKITSKRFNSLFLLIFLYGSEIWGIYDTENTSTWEKDVIEKNSHLFLQANSGSKQAVLKCCSQKRIWQITIEINYKYINYKVLDSSPKLVIYQRTILQNSLYIFLKNINWLIGTF